MKTEEEEFSRVVGRTKSPADGRDDIQQCGSHINYSPSTLSSRSIHLAGLVEANPDSRIAQAGSDARQRGSTPNQSEMEHKKREKKPGPRTRIDFCSRISRTKNRVSGLATRFLRARGRSGLLFWRANNHNLRCEVVVDGGVARIKIGFCFLLFETRPKVSRMYFVPRTCSR